jgi:hypothetical protein
MLAVIGSGDSYDETHPARSSRPSTASLISVTSHPISLPPSAPPLGPQPLGTRASQPSPRRWRAHKDDDAHRPSDPAHQTATTAGSPASRGATDEWRSRKKLVNNELADQEHALRSRNRQFATDAAELRDQVLELKTQIVRRSSTSCSDAEVAGVSK